MNESIALMIVLVIIFARDYRFNTREPLLISRVHFLDSPIPIPRQGPPSFWSNELFSQYLQKMSPEEAAIHDQNPVEYMIPLAQMSLVNLPFLMDIWAQKIEYNQEEEAMNLEVRYDEQTWTVNQLRQNLDAFKIFTTDASSRRWKSLLLDYQRVLQDAEQQVSTLAQKMSYRAGMASLRESQVAIEQAKTGIRQNQRVKQLTQLAFIFIPLSFITSLFGMNITALGTSSATVWMVVVSIIITYVVIILFWILLSYHTSMVKWIAARIRATNLTSVSRWSNSP